MSVSLEDMVVTAPSFATTRMLAAVWSVSTLPNASTHTDVTNVVAELGSQETELPVLVNTLLLVQLKHCHVHVTAPPPPFDDVDEVQGPTECDANANCLNIPGGYHCQCKEGYVGVGTLCRG